MDDDIENSHTAVTRPARHLDTEVEKGIEDKLDLAKGELFLIVEQKLQKDREGFNQRTMDKLKADLSGTGISWEVFEDEIEQVVDDLRDDIEQLIGDGRFDGRLRNITTPEKYNALRSKILEWYRLTQENDPSIKGYVYNPSRAIDLIVNASLTTTATSEAHVYGIGGLSSSGYLREPISISPDPTEPVGIGLKRLRAYRAIKEMPNEAALFFLAETQRLGSSEMVEKLLDTGSIFRTDSMRIQREGNEISIKFLDYLSHPTKVPWWIQEGVKENKIYSPKSDDQAIVIDLTKLDQLESFDHESEVDKLKSKAHLDELWEKYGKRLKRAK